MRRRDVAIAHVPNITDHGNGDPRARASDKRHQHPWLDLSEEVSRHSGLQRVFLAPGADLLRVVVVVLVGFVCQRLDEPGKHRLSGWDGGEEGGESGVGVVAVALLVGHGRALALRHLALVDGLQLII